MGLFTRNKEVVLQGRNIYRDKHNRYVYYKKSNHVGYVITPEKYSTFQMIGMRYILGVTAAALIYSFHVDVLIAALIGVVIIGALEFQLRFRLLPHLTQIPDFDVSDKPGVIENLADKADTGKLILLGVLYLVFAALFVLLAIENEYDEVVIWICCGAICIGAIYYAALHFLAARYRLKHPKVTKEKQIKLKIKK